MLSTKVKNMTDDRSQGGSGFLRGRVSLVTLQLQIGLAVGLAVGDDGLVVGLVVGLMVGAEVGTVVGTVVGAQDLVQAQLNGGNAMQLGQKSIQLVTLETSKERFCLKAAAP